MPIEKSLCSWWSIKSFQLVLLCLLSENSTSTHSKRSNKAKNYSLQSFWRCLNRLFAGAGRGTAVPAVERKEASAKTHIMAYKWIYHTQTKARQRRNHHFENGKGEWKWRERKMQKNGNGEENGKFSQYLGELEVLSQLNTARTEQTYIYCFISGQWCVGAIFWAQDISLS